MKPELGHMVDRNADCIFKSFLTGKDLIYRMEPAEHWTSLRAATDDVTIVPLQRLLVNRTKNGHPEGYEGQVRPRSGLALKQGLSVLKFMAPSIRIIEERWVSFILGTEPIVIHRGLRMAQLDRPIVQPAMRWLHHSTIQSGALVVLARQVFISFFLYWSIK